MIFMIFILLCFYCVLCVVFKRSTTWISFAAWVFNSYSGLPAELYTRLVFLRLWEPWPLVISDLPSRQFSINSLLQAGAHHDRPSRSCSSSETTHCPLEFSKDFPESGEGQIRVWLTSRANGLYVETHSSCAHARSFVFIFFSRNDVYCESHAHKDNILPWGRR